MTAYAIAQLHDVTMGPEIVEYLERIEATLAPYGGRYLVHGPRPDVVEGTWHGDLIIIGFPDIEQARGWYTSDAYRQIMRLRTENAKGNIMLVEGVPEGHRATDILQG